MSCCRGLKDGEEYSLAREQVLEASTITVLLALRGNYTLLAMKNVDRERGNGTEMRRIIPKKHSQHFFLNNVMGSLVVTSYLILQWPRHHRKLLSVKHK